VASETVGKHEVFGSNGCFHGACWQIEEWMLSAGAYRNQRHVKHWENSVIYCFQFCTAGLLVIMSI
jgi:hypothetical protein